MKVLIIDDERSIRNTLKEILEFEGHQITLAEDGAAGLETASAGSFDVIFCDIKMPGMDGVEVLDKLAESGNETPVVMISGHGSIDTAVECIKKGAFDFIQKPLDLNRILITLKNATDKGSLVRETKILKKKVGGVQEIIGESPAIVRIKNMIDRVAPTDARVLITGANGTGKELVARWLHEKSDRASMPFIEVNCAAIPSELIESELFGHEKGAFTGAQKQHKGKFEQADGGTLFLDEIGDMSLAAQAKVLRVLQENKLTKVGGDKDITVNVRVNRERQLPRGPLPPYQRHRHPRAVTGREKGRYSDAYRPFYQADIPGVRQAGQGDRRRRRRGTLQPRLERQHPRAAQRRGASADTFQRPHHQGRRDDVRPAQLSVVF